MVSTASEIFLSPKSKASNSHPGSEGCGGNFRTPPSQDMLRGLGHLSRPASDSREQRWRGFRDPETQISLDLNLQSWGFSLWKPDPSQDKTSRKHHPPGNSWSSQSHQKQNEKRARELQSSLFQNLSTLLLRTSAHHSDRHRTSCLEFELVAEKHPTFAFVLGCLYLPVNDEDTGVCQDHLGLSTSQEQEACWSDRKRKRLNMNPSDAS